MNSLSAHADPEWSNGRKETLDATLLNPKAISQWPIKLYAICNKQ